MVYRIMPFRKGRFATNEVLGVEVEDIFLPVDSSKGVTDISGVIIRKVVPGKTAHHAGLNCDDIIIRVGDDAVQNADQFCNLIEKELRKGEIKLLIRDRDRRQSITLVYLTVR